MKEITIISGKGGTGKTSVTAALASIAENALIVDCDVDAADMHLILDGKDKKVTDFYSGKKFEINSELCTKCGKCVEVCEFEAIENFTIDHVKCEACGVCYHFCPENAVKRQDRLCGYWYSADSRFGKFVTAHLNTGEENSGRLVAEIRKQAKSIADTHNIDIVISDGPPGISCPVIASITGTNIVLIVTEPTLSGSHDMKRAIELVKHFKIPCVVCINKCDINTEISKQIVQTCKEFDVEVIAQLPYTKEFTEAQLKCQTIMEYSTNNITYMIKRMYKRLLELI